MDYRYVKAFAAVAKHMNFSKAADELRIAQSAVSRQVALLEASLGKQLLIRSPKKVLLTVEGEQLYKQFQGFDSFAEDLAGKATPEVRIGTLQGILDNWLVDRLVQAKADLPSLAIHVLTEAEMEIWLREGKLDLALNSKRIDSDIVSSTVILEEEFVAISKERINLQKLCQYRWISGHSTKYLTKLSKEKSKSAIKVNSTAAMLRLVEKGVGVAVMASHIVPKELKVERQKVAIRSEKIYLCSLNYQIVPLPVKFMMQLLTK